MLSLQLDINVPEVPFNGHPLGIDIGLESFLATSDSELVDRPKFFGYFKGKLQLLQRRLKHKKLGSNNRRKLNSENSKTSSANLRHKERLSLEISAPPL